ncbi:ArnT family glycosyltransferase [Comamonas sp. J-3]|uniref:ArnT family glycosyltransferase n=1 Tax=Comamonas trifloxystrobinivorans TaxID=3350256 RepID=UPI003729E93D
MQQLWSAAAVRSKRWESQGWAYWGLCIALWLLALAWLRPLSDPDEGRYAVVALDMLRSGDWVTPHLNGLPFFHKPPLYYWLAAAGFQLLGVHEWVARLPSLLGAWLAAMSLLALLQRMAGALEAKAVVLVFVTLPFVYLAAQYANMDMLLAGCMSACTACAVWASVQYGRSASWRWWMAGAGVFAGLGFLAKGLIGMVLPGMVWCAWWLWERRWQSWHLALYPPAWLAAGAIAAPWAWLAQQRHPGFFHYFFVTQHFQRYTQTGFNNPQPWWFYLAVILLAGLPWTALAMVAAIRWWQQRKTAEHASGQPVGPDWARRSLDRCMLVWAVVVLLFFSVPQSKIVGYVLPALPPLAYAVVRCWGAVWRANGSPGQGESLGLRGWRGFRLAIGVAAAVCVVLAVGLGTKAVPAKAQWQSLKTLAAHSGERVMMLGHLYYEVPFYLPAQYPAWVVDDWHSDPAKQADNWKKELLDAAQLAPEQASQWLLQGPQAAEQLCAKTVVWVVGERAAFAALAPALAAEKPMAQIGPTAVWRIDPSSAICRAQR